jgi:hypothetical protein
VFLDGIASFFFIFKGKFRSFRAVMKAHRDFYLNLKELRTKETGNETWKE